MKNIFLLSLIIFISSCSFTNISFWDDNQAYKSVDINVGANKLNCNVMQDLSFHVSSLEYNVFWLEQYSINKKTKDIIEMIKPIKETLNDFRKRIDSKELSVGYCRLKQKILIEQTNELSRAIMVRY